MLHPPLQCGCYQRRPLTAHQPHVPRQACARAASCRCALATSLRLPQTPSYCCPVVLASSQSSADVAGWQGKVARQWASTVKNKSDGPGPGPAPRCKHAQTPAPGVARVADIAAAMANHCWYWCRCLCAVCQGAPAALPNSPQHSGLRFTHPQRVEGAQSTELSLGYGAGCVASASAAGIAAILVSVKPLLSRDACASAVCQGAPQRLGEQTGRP